jgi:hypothetical protein
MNRKCKYCSDNAKRMSYRSKDGIVSKEIVCVSCHYKTNDQLKRDKGFTVEFEFEGKKLSHNFQPEEEDWWTAFTDKRYTFDVHYCEDYNDIYVYQVVDGQSKWDVTIHKQSIN